MEEIRNTGKLLEFFRQALDELPLQVWFLSDADTYGMVNALHSRFCGRPREEMEFRKLTELFPPEVASSCRESNLAALEARKTMRSEEWVEDADGGKRLLSISKTPRFDSDGGLLHIVCIAEDVTEARASEEALIASEKRYQRVMSEISDVVWHYEVDQQGHFIQSYMSPAAERILGLPEGSVNHDFEVYFSHLHPEDFLMIEELFNNTLLEAMKDVTVEFRVVRPDGRVRWLISRGSASRMPNGHVAAFGTCSDITERKLAEEEVRTREKQLRDVFESQCELICRFRPDGTLTFVNDPYCRYFGRTREELLGVSFLTLIPEEDGAVVRENLLLLTPENPINSCEHRVLHPSGEVRWQHWTDRALLEDDGSFVEIQSVGRDITDLKLAQERLADKKWRLDCILEGTNTGTWQWNILTGETVYNPKWGEMLGYDSEELLPTTTSTWKDLVHPDDLEPIDKCFRNHLDGKTDIYSCEYRMRHKEGNWVWVHDCGRIQTRDQEGRPVLMFGTHTDITARREAEEAREYHRQLLEVIVSISSMFMNTGSRGVDEAIELALLQMGEFESVDRCYVFLFDDETGLTWSNTHEWCAPGVTPLKDTQQGISAGVTPWWLARLRNDEPIAVSRLSDLPPEAESERAVMEARSIQSFLVVPVRIGEELMGFLGFDAVNSRHSWPRHTVSLIRMAADIAACALERRNSERRLEESEENYRTLFDTIDHMIFVFSPEGRILHANPSVTGKLGYSFEELKRMRLLDLHPFPLREEAGIILKAVRAGERNSCSLPLLTRENVLLPVETLAWHGKWNGMECMYAMSRDLSQETEALQKFERFFRMIPIPLAVTRFPERTFVEVNDSFLALLGLEEKEVLDRTTEELGLIPDPEDLARLEKAVREEGFARNLKLGFRGKDGVPRRGLFSGDLIESSGRRYFLSVMQETTDP